MIQPYYEDVSVTLYCCDNAEILSMLGTMVAKVDHVITDPPFAEETHSRARSNRGRQRDPVTAIDFTAIDFTAIDFTLRALGPLCRRWFIATLDWRHMASTSTAIPRMLFPASINIRHRSQSD